MSAALKLLKFFSLDSTSSEWYVAAAYSYSGYFLEVTRIHSWSHSCFIPMTYIQIFSSITFKKLHQFVIFGTCIIKRSVYSKVAAIVNEIEGVFLDGCFKQLSHCF